MSGLGPFKPNAAILGDAIEVMAQFPDACVDAICTDPPYGLEFMGKEWDSPLKNLAGLDLESDKPHQRHNVKHWSIRNQKCLRCGHWRWSGTPCECDSPLFTKREIGMEVYQQWTAAWAAEAYRILKPGAYMLVMGGCRTHHRLGCGLEDAGFEIRDELAWIFASGFPKNYSLSKGLLQRFYEVSSQGGVHFPETIGGSRPDYPSNCRFCGESLLDGIVVARYGEPSLGDAQGYTRPSLPSVKIREGNGHTYRVSWGALSFHRATQDYSLLESWLQILSCALESNYADWLQQLADDTMGAPDRLVEAFRHALHSDNGLSNSEVSPSLPSTDMLQISSHNDRKSVQSSSHIYSTRYCPACQMRISKMLPDVIGLGSVLKPAHEPIWLCKKPNEGAYVDNVLKHEVGALNIDGSRIPYASEDDKESSRFGVQTDIKGGGYGSKRPSQGDVHARNVLSSPTGRWPANVLVDCWPEEFIGGVVIEGEGKGQQAPIAEHRSRGLVGGWAEWEGPDPRAGTVYTDNEDLGDGLLGVYTRFFVIPKPSKSEKSKGCMGLYWRREKGGGHTRIGRKEWEKLVAEEERIKEETAKRVRLQARGNIHVTVKPVRLMKWLIRLITPHQHPAVVVDPFCGSGTSMVAGSQLNWEEGYQMEFYGIDKGENNITIANARLEAESKAAKQLKLV